MCSFVSDVDPPSLISAVAEFKTMTGVTGEAASHQREWDEIKNKEDKEESVL